MRTLVLLVITLISISAQAAASKPCGIKGTIQLREKECATTRNLNGHNWTLVTQMPTGQQVWRDDSTQLLWSDRASKRMPLYDIVEFNEDGDKILREKYCGTSLTGRIRGGITQVSWRIPSQSDWSTATANGLKELFPNIEDEYWWTATKDNGSDEFLAYNGFRNIFESFRTEYSYLSYRCVGR